MSTLGGLSSKQTPMKWVYPTVPNLKKTINFIVVLSANLYNGLGSQNGFLKFSSRKKIGQGGWFTPCFFFLRLLLHRWASKKTRALIQIELVGSKKDFQTAAVDRGWSPVMWGGVLFLVGIFPRAKPCGWLSLLPRSFYGRGFDDVFWTFAGENPSVSGA